MGDHHHAVDPGEPEDLLLETDGSAEAELLAAANARLVELALPLRGLVRSVVCDAVMGPAERVILDDSVDYGGPTNPQGDSGGTMLGGELINLTETVDTGTGTADVDTLFWMAGNNSATKMPMIAITTNSSTSVKPLRRDMTPPTELNDQTPESGRPTPLNITDERAVRNSCGHRPLPVF